MAKGNAGGIVTILSIEEIRSEAFFIRKENLYEKRNLETYYEF